MSYVAIFAVGWFVGAVTFMLKPRKCNEVGAAPAETAQTDDGWGCDSPFHLRDDGGETAGTKFGSGGDAAEWEQNKAGSHHTPPLSNEPLPKRSVEMVPQVSPLDSTWDTDNRAEYATSGPCGETAGEMTAEQFAQTEIGKGILTGARSMLHPDITLDPLADWQRPVAYHFAEAFAKQRLEQAERQRDNEIAKKETWRLLAGSNQTTATEALALVEKQRTELREMREAAEKVVKRLRLVFTWSDVQEAGLPEEFSVELGELEGVLARKAGSPD